ncbi:MAG: MFS transporter [Spirochaetales bacterium]|nr:MFS transporter [Spirochaetales bacterium]
MIISKFKKTWSEYPHTFWILVASTFIDRLGGTMLYPFFVLYITRKFEVGLTEAGILLAVFSLTGMAGSIIGGALSDRYGRKKLVISGLLFSGMASLVMGFLQSYSMFFVFAFMAGFLGELGGPARMVMIAEILPEEKHSAGYSIMRISGNLAWVIGPAIGGFFAAYSYLILFISDAVTSAITALIVFLKIPETLKQHKDEEEHEPFIATLKGYRQVLGDHVFRSFIIFSILMLLVYQQLYSTYAVFLRDVHGFPDSFYGFLLSINAFAVVIFQMPVTRWTARRDSYLMMSAGTFLFIIGYTATGIVAGAAMFTVTMMVITLGEMIIIPVSQALVARLAPKELKGRYMGMYNFSWSVPSLIGPWAAGLIVDNMNPRFVWYICGVIASVAFTGFFILWKKQKNPMGSSVDNNSNLD